MLGAIAAANVGHAVSYGEDAWTARAEEVFREHFGPQSQAWLLFTGTGANVAALASIAKPWEAVVCAEVSNLNHDECGAVERVAGIKLLPTPVHDGKLTVDHVTQHEWRLGEVNGAQPRVVSITQSTERGTVYTLSEIRAITEAAHAAGMTVHMDGSRLANAAATLGLGLRELTTDAGVDVVSFGGTRNGLLCGEAVVFCNPELGEGFAWTRKQLGQLGSKQRFVAAQFEALLSDDLWLRNARRANAMATRLADAVRALPGVEILHPVEANVLYVRLPLPAADHLVETMPYLHYFHVWDAGSGELRWMCSWDTSEADVDGFATAIGQAIERHRLSSGPK